MVILIVCNSKYVAMMKNLNTSIFIRSSKNVFYVDKKLFNDTNKSFLVKIKFLLLLVKPLDKIKFFN